MTKFTNKTNISTGYEGGFIFNFKMEIKDVRSALDAEMIAISACDLS